MKFWLLLGSLLGSLVMGGYTDCPADKSGEECPQTHNPVCGIPTEGLPKTFQNSCEACRQQGVIKGYLPDACGSLLTNCQDAERVNCSASGAQAKTSCGFQKKGLPVAIQNGLCCKDDHYDQILVGWNCEGVELGNFVDRDPHLRIDEFNCPDIPAPVCAVLPDGSERTFNNSCDLHRSRVRFVSEKEGPCREKPAN